MTYKEGNGLTLNGELLAQKNALATKAGYPFKRRWSEEEGENN